MAKDEAEIEGWMYDFAWRLRDIAQQTNDRLDTKATDIIKFSSTLVPIITGILLYFADKPFFLGRRSLWFASLILLLLSIFFAFTVIWLRDQGMINTTKHIKASLVDTDIKKILENTAYDIAKWQNVILDAKRNKTKYLYISSFFFIIALIIIAFSSLYSY